MSLTVCCVLVDGPVKSYDADHVVRLEKMVLKYLDEPFRFVCLTDGSRGHLSCETIQIASRGEDVPENGRGYWAKVELFNRANGLTGRCLFLDLDVLVVGPLGSIVRYPSDLALTADALVDERKHLDTDRYGRKLVRRFNSSVIVWDAGAHDYLFDRLTNADIHRLSTDQDWIGEQAKTAAAMPLHWFPRISRVQPPFDGDARVVLVKKPKPADACRQWDWFEPMWGGWAA